MSEKVLLSCLFIIFIEVELENVSPPKCNYLKNKKTLSEFFVPFLEYASSFKHFERKDDRHSLCISKITDCEKLA